MILAPRQTRVSCIYFIAPPVDESEKSMGEKPNRGLLNDDGTVMNITKSVHEGDVKKDNTVSFGINMY